MEQYEQSNFKIRITFVNGNFSIQTNGFSGRCYTKASIVYREPREFVLSSHTNLEKIFSLDMDYLKEYFEIVYKELKEHDIKLQIYYEVESNLVNVNGIYDTRFSSIIKIVFIDRYNDSYMDESVVENFNIDKIISEIQLIIEKNKKSICSKNKRLFTKFWNGTPVILSSRAAGYFIHEIVGHMLEEDVYVYTSDLYNDIHIPPKLCVCDKVEGFEYYTALNKIDDMGNEIKTLLLIDQGKINNILAINEEKSFDGKLYGVARRESYLKNIMPRMRGTFISNSENMQEKDFIKMYQEAIFVDHIYYGTCIFGTGDFLIQGDGCYIRNNEIECMITDLKIQGNIKKYLEGIDHIGNDFKPYVCECGKIGNVVRVGIGSPTISIVESRVEGVAYKNG